MENIYDRMLSLDKGGCETVETDVEGRIKNIQVPISKPLTPLFEAITNSLEAIEEAREPEGRIEIEIIRDEKTLFADTTSSTDKQLAEIVGFIVRDNGIGFDKRNYHEFLVSDTTYKAKQGGKGVGRFTWLVTFDKVEIESIYVEDGQKKQRKFLFCPYGSGIDNYSCQDVIGGQRGTIVYLTGYKEKFRKSCPKRVEVIAAYIVEEFLDVFLGPSCPKILLQDKMAKQYVDLDDFFHNQMFKFSELKTITIKNTPFDLVHVQLHSTHIPEHRMYFCARDRVVFRERLTGIPNLAPRLKDKDDREFVYAVYVHSLILDSSVNADRTGFNLLEQGDSLFPDEVSLGEIRNKVREHCIEYLSPYTQPIKAKKEERIRQFVAQEGIMYRPILDRLEGAFDRIEPDATDDKIDLQLYEAYHDFQVALRKEGQDLLEASTSGADFDEFEEHLEEYFAKISEVNRADLARYVAHRKAIIEFLKHQLARKDNGKYSLEDKIHNIIFPRFKTSDEISFEGHNLWLVDERLAFHVFLMSDKPISQAKHLTSDSKKEPDILIFDKAIAFSEAPDVPFSSITIIEFKKPQRNDYSDKENPFVQVTNLIEDIRNGKAKLADGRAMPIPANLPFYCYILCDITPNLERWAYQSELQKTPDELGFFGYKRQYNAYCEVISYSKLVSDADKRHLAFFERLGLPRTFPRI
jgi:hypothetical protein